MKNKSTPSQRIGKAQPPRTPTADYSLDHPIWLWTGAILIRRPVDNVTFSCSAYTDIVSVATLISKVVSEAINSWRAVSAPMFHGVSAPRTLNDARLARLDNLLFPTLNSLPVIILVKRRQRCNNVANRGGIIYSDPFSTKLISDRRRIEISLVIMLAIRCPHPLITPSRGLGARRDASYCLSNVWRETSNLRIRLIKIALIPSSRYKRRLKNYAPQGWWERDGRVNQTTLIPEGRE
jgi:hypothetical protein